MSDAIAQPELEAPGAGLPLPELVAVRIAFFTVRACWQPEAATGRYASEGARLLELVRALGDERAVVRVLVPRLTGLEDSSRNWSAFMALEHLVIVERAILGILRSLASGRRFPVEVNTADVKPSPAAGPEVLERFGALTERYGAEAGELVAAAPAGATHSHPWFGPLNAYGWHCLAAIHRTIHRRQVEAISARMP